MKDIECLKVTSKCNINVIIITHSNINFSNAIPKSNHCGRDWSRFDQENCVVGYFSVNWDNLLLSSNTNIEKSCKTFLEKFESLFDTYAPPKKFLTFN